MHMIQYLAVSTTVFLSIFETNIGEALSNGGSGFVSSQDTFAWSHNIVGNGTELILELLRWVVEVGCHFLSIEKYGRE